MDSLLWFTVQLPDVHLVCVTSYSPLNSQKRRVIACCDTWKPCGYGSNTLCALLKQAFIISPFMLSEHVDVCEEYGQGLFVCTYLLLFV